MLGGDGNHSCGVACGDVGGGARGGDLKRGLWSDSYLVWFPRSWVTLNVGMMENGKTMENDGNGMLAMMKMVKKMLAMMKMVNVCLKKRAKEDCWR